MATRPGKAPTPAQWTPVIGGPVPVPVGALTRVARLAWLCNPYSHPGLRLAYAAPPLVSEEMQAIEDASFTVQGNELLVSFKFNSQPADALVPLGAVARVLAGAPDGTVIEMRSARVKQSSPLGAHAWRGVVQGGLWHIAESSPVAEATTLAEALALAEAMEGGRRMVMRDEAEAQRVEAHVGRVLADYFGANALQRNGAELALRRRDNTLFAHVAARVFWSRYAQVWPLQDEDAESG